MAVYRTLIGEKTGLRPDPYFSAGKIKWIIDDVEGIRENDISVIVSRDIIQAANEPSASEQYVRFLERHRISLNQKH